MITTTYTTKQGNERESLMKTDLTRKAEECLWKSTAKQGVFGCFEVTIGWYGKERVDYITYSTDNTVRCYEIKVTMADLKSKANQTFIGDYNYLVVTPELWEAIRADNNLTWMYYYEGIYVFGDKEMISVKKAKKRTVDMGTRVTILESMVRSLSRETKKFYKIDPFWTINEPEIKADPPGPLW